MSRAPLFVRVFAGRPALAGLALGLVTALAVVLVMVLAGWFWPMPWTNL